MPWYENAFFYHIYPLGFCGAPERNDFHSPPVERLNRVLQWIPHLVDLGITAVYLGPVFESVSHGYDTVDYMRVDRRLGTNQTLRNVVDRLHEAGIRVVLDGVFHHVGRSFFAMDDLRRRRRNSPYRDWISGVNFERPSAHGDPFSYDCWEGHDTLVKLNPHCPAVVHYLLKAVQKWAAEFDIDGLRLDVAYALERKFLRSLRAATREMKADFWLMGEIIHGDYSQYLGLDLLHSTTNYEGYKGLYSSHNDRNYFEIAHSLDRQFGPGGLYRDALLYNFVDNHDVNRVASQLADERHLAPLYLLLFTVPGIPSLYYGSEWGLEGRKLNGDDRPLRPALDILRMGQQPRADLVHTVRAYQALRQSSRALQAGTYRTLFVASEQFAFLRELDGEQVWVAVNASSGPVCIEVDMEEPTGRWVDLLDGHAPVSVANGMARLELPPLGGRVMRRETA